MLSVFLDYDPAMTMTEEMIIYTLRALTIYEDFKRLKKIMHEHGKTIDITPAIDEALQRLEVGMTATE